MAQPKGTTKSSQTLRRCTSRTPYHLSGVRTIPPVSIHDHPKWRVGQTVALTGFRLIITCLLPAEINQSITNKQLGYCIVSVFQVTLGKAPPKTKTVGWNRDYVSIDK
jgi:hypothetical protein